MFSLPHMKEVTKKEGAGGSCGFGTAQAKHRGPLRASGIYLGTEEGGGEFPDEAEQGCFLSLGHHVL